MTVTDLEKRSGVILALLVMASGIYLIAPFFQPMFWAGLMVMTSWSLMVRLNKAWHRPLLNAGLLTLIWTFLVIGPLVAIVLMLSGDAKDLVSKAMLYIHAPLPDLPAFVGKIPGVGTSISKGWLELQAQGADWFGQFKPYVNKTVGVLLSQTGNIGKILMDVSLTLLFTFLFYWEGERIVQFAHSVLGRIAGSKSRSYVSIVTSTLQNVINGIVGTALAQAVLALIGFAVAGVPGALLLGVGTFFLALIPMGPPLLWLPAAGWLFYQGDIGWAIALAAWGALVVSGVDNILKPILISRGSVLPLPLVLLGVFGGVLNLGFIGIFIGPAVIALGYSLIMVWLNDDQEQVKVEENNSEESVQTK